MNTQERALYIYNRCRKLGMTHHGAIGLLGNLQGETSDFDPMSLETLYRQRFGLTDAEYVRRADNELIVYNGKTFVFDSAGFGIAQWTWWSRKKGLLELARRFGKSVGDLDVQIDYMVEEMKNHYTQTWKILTTTNDYTKAVQICVNEYEKPANALSAIQTRNKYAKNWFDIIPNSDVSTEATTPSTPAPVTPNTPATSGISFDRRKLIKMALSQVGYKEKRSNSQLDDFTANAGINNYTKYARDLDNLAGFYNGKKQGYAWCDMFVDWCFVTCFGVIDGLNLLCQKLGGAGAGCTYSMQYFQAKEQFVRRNQGRPEVGDQIFFGSGLNNSGHTGIVYAVDSNKVYTIEGNTTNSASVAAEGTSVLKKSYSLSHGSIIGYGRPKWNDGYIGNGFEISLNDKEEIITPTETPVDPNYPTLRYGDSNDFVKKAQELLIAKGYSCGPDGADGDFGAATLNAVNQLRADNKFSATGVIDKAVWDVLNKTEVEEPQQPEITPAPQPTPENNEFVTLSIGMQNEQVKQAQKALIAKGYSCGPDGADGDFGQNTLIAVNNYRKDLGLEQNGVIDYALWTKLIEIKVDNVPAPTPSMKQFDRNKLIKVAMAEVGYYEKASEAQLDDREANGGQKNFNKYARDLDSISHYYYHDRKQGLNWCDIFCDWCFVAAYGVDDSFTVNCQPQRSYGAGCPESMAYYKSQGRLDMNPQVGDQFFLSDGMGSTGHTGLVIGVNGNYSVTTIEGNQQIIGKNGVDGVVKKTRLISEIAGFGHPKYNDGYGTSEYIGEPFEEEPVEEEPVEEEPVEEETNQTLPLLQVGMVSRAVKSMQILLQSHGYNLGLYGADGNFGSGTYNVLKSFQAANQLPVTGECDLDTWNKLING